MDRKQFLNACAAGLCACTASSLVPSSSLAAADPPESWRIGFVQQRCAALLRILSSRLDEKSMNEVLHDLGSECAKLWDQVGLHRGDFDGFSRLLKGSASGDEVTWDRDKGILRVASPERADCFCPLNSVHRNTPPVVCNCSLGWQQQAWETVLGKKVRVDLKESILRGGKRCVFEIHAA